MIIIYDYLVVGAGLTGATFAHEATRRGKKCLVTDKRKHIAGNAYTKDVDGIHVHEYGAHIFHTNNKAVWDFVNRFAVFNHYINAPIARIGDELYNLPFNMNTFNKMWGVITPREAMEKIEAQRGVSANSVPQNLEEQAICLVGREIYEKLIKGYTEKQWGRLCSELPASIIKRLPLRFTYNNNYFNDIYQGIPIGGYTQMVQNMLHGVDVQLGISYEEYNKNNPNRVKKVIYTGAIDAFYDYCFGHLAYRSLRFDTTRLEESNYQGNAVVNYTAADVPYTRVIEHKHFEFGTQAHTIITHEYPTAWTPKKEPYYPINDSKNQALYLKYKELAGKQDSVIFCGRLGTYAYLDMDKAVSEALALVNVLIP